MSDRGPTHAEHPARTSAEAGRRSALRLGPGEPFPEDPAALDIVELQVLHSRLSRQLDHEYLMAPAGPDPVTLDRHRQLVVELDAREIMADP